MADQTPAPTSADANATAPPPKRPAGVLSPCLMVYPIPSIADETFLYTLFKHKVGRSLFGGFGKSRFAIAELTDKTMLNNVVKLVKAREEHVKHLKVEAHAALMADNDRHGPSSEEPLADAGADASTTDAAKGTGYPLPQQVNAEELTLADLFANPGPTSSGDGAGRLPGDGVESDKDVDVFDASNSSVDYLLNLSWRGLYPIFVAISPVTIEEMYTCGGAVPEKKPKLQQPADDGHPSKQEEAPAQQRERPPARAGVKAAPATHSHEKAAAPRFPKDCCQKCGSPSHFTRKCDGSGPGVTVATTDADADADTAQGPTDPGMASATPLKRASEVAANRTPATDRASSSAGPTPSAAPVAVFPKDCCQKCGSKEHFTRHCDGSGVKTTASSDLAAPAPVAKKARHEEEEHAVNPKAAVAKTEKVSATEGSAAPAPSPAPAHQGFVRTSKDQCKFCGSDAHLSRHCPSK